MGKEVKWYVKIFEFGSVPERVEKVLGPYDTERLADKADAGVNRNLNHDLFYTRIVAE